LSRYSRHFFEEDSLNNSWSNMYAYIPEGARVLDVGCSTGNFGAALEQLKNCTVVGVDLNADDIAEAATRITTALVLDITAKGVVEALGKFDVVLFADVIEHIPDPRAALRAVHGFLRPGGFIVYSIPHMGHASIRFDMLAGRFPYTELGLLDKTHLHFYDRPEVHDVFASSGFRIVDESPTLVGYPDEWTAERLAGMGLVATPSFFDMLRQSEANVYQFVGRAVPKGDAPEMSWESETS
jgi:SAM-dependent methyltransferase